MADKLVERGLASTPFDLFSLKPDELAALNLGTEEEPRQLGEKTARKILDALEQARGAPLAKWILALGLPGVGETTAFKLAALHRDFRALASSTKLPLLLQVEDLKRKVAETNPKARAHTGKTAAQKAELKQQHDAAQEQLSATQREIADHGLGGIGPAVAREVIDFLASPRGRKLVDSVHRLNLRATAPAPAAAGAGSPFAGKTVVVTGTLARYGRDAVKDLLRSKGATVTDSVSSMTDLLIVGTEAGSKLDKAKALGIRVVEEKEFLDLLGEAT